jgi:hypothetical protein
MKIRLFFIAIGILGCVSILIANGPVSAQTAGQPAKAASPASGPSKSDCLNCHGPFDKIIESTGDYVAPSGEKLSPHRYVPHDSKKDEDIPECTNCHTAHPLDPLPAQGSIDLSKVNVQWCYTSCHHEKNFTSCKQCHDQ